MERARDRQLDRPAGSLDLRLPAAFLDRRGLSRDHQLSRAVVVRRPHAVDPAAELLDHLVLEPEDRGHRARDARAPPPRSPGRARERARSPRESKSRVPLPARSIRRRSGRRRSRARSRAREGRPGSQGSWRRERAAAPRSRSAPRADASKQSRRRSMPAASLPSSKTLIAAGSCSAISRPMPRLERALAQGNKTQPCSFRTPFHQSRTPGEAGAHAGHQHEIALMEPSVRLRLGEREWNRAR